MAKSRTKESKDKIDEQNVKSERDEKDAKGTKADAKDKNALVGRVRKVIKKSRRKLGEEKFEKELQRTINFLTELRDQLSQAHTQAARNNSGNGKAQAAAKADKPKAAK